MSQSEEHIQIFYELAIATGKSLDLHKMLKSALLVYLRKLNCVAAIVYKIPPSKNSSYNVEDIFSIPYTLNTKDTYTEIHNLLLDNYNSDEMGAFKDGLPITGVTALKQFYHIMRLGNFGFLVLIKSDKKLDYNVLLALRDVNNKLAEACTSCINVEALEESEARFRELSEFLPEMICETDIDGNLTFINKYAIDTMEYDRDDVKRGFHFLNLFPIEEHARAKKDFKKALAAGHDAPNEYIAITKNKKELYVLVYTEKLIKNNKTVGVRGVMIDITERKANEKRLTENEKYLKTINQFASSVLKKNTIDELIWEVINLIIKELGFVDCIIYLMDEDKKNLVQRAAFGDKEEGETVIDPIIIAFGKGIVGTVAKTGIPEIIKDTSKDSRYIVDDKIRFSELAVPIIADGEVIGVIDTEHPEKDFYRREHLEKLETVSGLVSSRLKNAISQEKLILAQVSLTKLSTAVEQSPLSVMITDIDGYIEFVNPTFIEVTGYSDKESIGKKTSILSSGVHPKSFYIELWETIRKGEKWEGEMVNRRKNGEKIWVLNSISPIRDSENKITNFVSIQVDISAIKKLEGELILAKDKAEKANQAKSEFIANMSHEIRTPMNAILGFSEVLYHKLDSVKHRKMIQSVMSSGNLLLSLLNDILDLSKIEADKLEISPQALDLKNILQEIKLLFNDKAGNKGIEINVFVPGDFPDLLLLDEIRIKQVFFNLVGNAVKFTHQGYINLRVEFALRSEDNGELKIEVEDTGIGIPDTQQKLIFEAFRQQSGQSNRTYGGAGLGLAITKRLVEKMGGTITVSSQESKGSSFKIILPKVPICTSDLRKKNDLVEFQNITFEKASILVVDDVGSNIEIVETILTDVGLEVVSAESGEIALEILNHLSPDLILLDVRMPGIDGYEVARRIKVNPAWTHIPVIAFTASVFESERLKNIENFDGTLFKPVNQPELFAQLSQFLKHKKEIVSKSLNPSGKELPEDIPEELLIVLPQVKEILEQTMLPKWETIKDQFILFKIEEFANELKQIAVDFNFSFLLEYTEIISESLENIDLETLREALNDFPHIIEDISRKIKNQSND